MKRAMSQRNRTRVPPVALACLLSLVATAFWAAPALAQAVPVSTTDTTKHPSIDVDSGGAAHLAWLTGDEKAIVHCRLPAGAAVKEPGGVSDADCDRTTQAAGSQTGASMHSPHVLVEPVPGQPDRIVIYWAECCGDEYAYHAISNDGGQTFSIRQAADTRGREGSSLSTGFGANNAVLYDNATKVAGVAGHNSGGGGADVQVMPLSGGPVNTWASSVIEGFGGTQDIGFVGGQLFVAAFRGSDSSLKVASGGGNEESSWSAPISVDALAVPKEGLSMDQGPSGLFVTYVRERSAGGYLLVGRRLVGGTRLAVIARDTRFLDPEISQGHDGVLYATWNDSDRDFRYASSVDGGKTWSTSRLLMASGASAKPFTHGAAAGPGAGYTAWNDDGAIRVLGFPPVDEFVTLGIRTRQLRVGRRGAARVRLTCPRSEQTPPCRGRLAVQTRGNVRFRGRVGRLMLARTRFRLGAGQTRAVRLRIPGPRLRVVRSQRRARRAVAIARVGDGAGNRATRRKALRIVPR